MAITLDGYFIAIVANKLHALRLLIKYNTIINEILITLTAFEDYNNFFSK